MIDHRDEPSRPAMPRDASFEFASGTGTYEWDPAGDTLTWSPGLMRIYGLTRAPAGEGGFSALVHPDDRVRVEAETSWFLGSDATSYSHTFRIVRPDGQVRFVLDRGAIERDGQGRVVRLRGMNVDLTGVAASAADGIAEAVDRDADQGRRRAERERFARHRDELEVLYAEAPLGLGLIDRELRFVRINPALAEINGYAVEEHLGRRVWDLLPDLRESAEPALRRVIETGEPLRDVPIRGTTPARPGVPREWREHFYPLFDEAGAVEGIGIVCEEVTERIAAERALAESEERFRLALAGSPITVFEHDAELRYRWLYNSKLGYSDTFAIGKTDHEIMDPEAAAVLVAFKSEVLENGRPGRREVIAAAPGQPREIFDLHVHPKCDDAGRVIGLTCVSTDVTETKRAEAALQAAHDTFRHLVEQSPMGVYTVDADFRLAHVSEGARKALDEPRLIGRDFGEFVRAIWPEPFASDVIGRFRHTLATGEPYQAPTTVERRIDNGETVVHDWKIERITMPDGRPGVVCHFYDLTKRQAYQERIETLIREVSHRSKNILTLVDAVARLTAGSAGPDAFLESFRARLRALAASHDLLLRNDADGADLEELVRGQLLHFGDLLDRRILLDGPAVHVGPHAAQPLAMALHELATNAVKYGALSGDGGTVAIAWSVASAEGGSATDGPRFAMSWVETDGPAVAEPVTRGFGHRVATSIIRSSLGGEAHLDYASDGLRWTLRCPLSGLGTEPAPDVTADG